MRGSAILASLTLSICALSAAPVFAQAAGQAKPAQTPALLEGPRDQPRDDREP